jgi:POT family proton-dependent oligopeptide transporter
MDLRKIRHPKGLFICSVTEAWERLGFFAVQSILILYFVQFLKLDDKQAYYLYTAITGLLYASPVVGGYLADKILNFKRAVLLGLCLFAAGYFLLNTHSSRLIFIAFALQIAGNGFVKGNITSLLGQQYESNDIRRDSGFTLFYFAINIGQIIGPLLVAVALKLYGFSTAFTVSGISVVFSLIIFYWGKSYLLSDFEKKSKEHKTFPFFAFFIIAVAVIILLSLLLSYPALVNFLILIIALLSLIYLIYIAVSSESKTDRNKMLTIIMLFIFSALFWALFMQTFTSLLLFTKRNVDMFFFGMTFPAPTLVAFQGVFLVLLAPLFSILWLRLGNSRWQPSFGLKFSYGFLFLTLGYLTLVIATHYFSVDSRINASWILLTCLLLAIAELCLSAIGLSAISNLAPKKHLGMLMGFWFLTISVGIELANKLDVLAYVPANVIQISKTLAIYEKAFFDFMIISLAVFVVSFLLVPVIKKMSEKV